MHIPGNPESLKVGVYTIRDALSGFSDSVLFVQYSDQIAVRSFTAMAASTEKNYANEFPNDRYLVRLGWYDVTLGQLIPDREEFGNAAQFKPVKTESK